VSSLREESLREASLQEPPLVLFVDENYETYLNKFTVHKNRKNHK
jgi:hypothetical protein